MLEEKMTNLRKEIIEYATHVEGMIDKAITALMRKDSSLLNEVIEKDEIKANESELDIEELCTTLIAQYEPKAKDLRTILMVMKMNNDLERAADHAVNIAESSLFLIERPAIKPLLDIPRMAEEAVGMLKDAIDAFVREDAILAAMVCERDNIVDNLGQQILRELITFMSADPTTIERSMRLLNIARNLERIGDLSTNISEDVIFMVEGRVIKHRRDQEEGG
jgi:phosphate transport system protein